MSELLFLYSILDSETCIFAAVNLSSVKFEV